MKHLKGKWFVKWLNSLHRELDAETRQLNHYISPHLVKEDIYFHVQFCSYASLMREKFTKRKYTDCNIMRFGITLFADDWVYSRGCSVLEEGVLVQLKLSYSSTVCKSEESEYITFAKMNSNCGFSPAKKVPQHFMESHGQIACHWIHS